MWTGPYGEWGSRKHMLSSLDQSLKHLGLDYVDNFYHDNIKAVENTKFTEEELARIDAISL